MVTVDWYSVSEPTVKSRAVALVGEGPLTSVGRVDGTATEVAVQFEPVPHLSVPRVESGRGPGHVGGGLGEVGDVGNAG